MTEAVKVCFRCKTEKARSLFGVSKKSKDGLHTYCNACMAERARLRRAINPELTRQKQNAWNAVNRERRLEQSKARKKANPERTKAERARMYARHREKELANMRAWKEKNKELLKQKRHENYWRDIEATRAKQMDYRRSIPEKQRAWTMKRIAQKKQATPSWANHAEIERIYRLAVEVERAIGVPHEVDHIVPLQSDLVCGLHWEGNLQVLPRAMNRSKSNRYWPDMPSQETHSTTLGL